MSEQAIVDRLREYPPGHVCNEAADLIERLQRRIADERLRASVELRAEIDRQRAALKHTRLVVLVLALTGAVALAISHPMNIAVRQPPTKECSIWRC